MLWLNSTDAQKRIHAEKVDVARASFSLKDTRRTDSDCGGSGAAVERGR
jgi:hypothetical protein